MDYLILPYYNQIIFPHFTSQPITITDPIAKEVIFSSIQKNILLAIISQTNTFDKNSETTGISAKPIIISHNEDNSLTIVLSAQHKVSFFEKINDSYVGTIREGKALYADNNLNNSNLNQLKYLKSIFSHWMKKRVLVFDQQQVLLKSIQNNEQLISAISTYIIKDKDFKQHLFDNHSFSEVINEIHQYLQSNYIEIS